jgi:hypothetical protein
MISLPEALADPRKKRLQMHLHRQQPPVARHTLL